MVLLNVIRGGGDLASGVALRLHRAGLRLIITELLQPLVVRRRASFAEAVFQSQAQVEGVTARLVGTLTEGLALLAGTEIPVLVDPQAESLSALRSMLPVPTPIVLIDARMTKSAPDYGLEAADLIIGLGPGFVAGQNCHAAVETNRGFNLGRVFWQGGLESNTGVPDKVNGRTSERVLRAPVDGIFTAHAEICDHLEAGQLVGEVGGIPVVAPFCGIVRGLLRSGLQVSYGAKIGDLDPRDDPRFCTQASDKSLAVGGGVLEAILACPELRPYFWAAP